MPVVALEYHDVIAGPDWNASGFPGNSAGSYKMSVDLFDAHLRAVANAGQEAGADIRNLVSSTREARDIVFTFDDGGSSALHVIADRLDGRGWRGHFLITTGRIGTPGFLSAADVTELHRRGHVIGSHSETHPARMSQLTRTEQRNEWTRSCQQLEDLLGSRVEVASVPGGYFDRATAESAAAAGVRWLFTSEPETTIAVVDGCSVFGRFTLRRTSPARVVQALVGRWPHARTAEWMKWSAKKLAKRTAGKTYLRIRAALFGDPDS